MPVQVTRDPGAGDIRNIHAQIKTVRSHGFLKGPLHPDQNLEELSLLPKVQLRDMRDMPFRDDHQVTVIVRVAIEDHGVVDGADKD